MSLGAFGDEGDIVEHDETRSGGPSMCARPCSECSGGMHHFSDAMIGLAGEEDDGPSPVHEAETAGCEAWYVCKHCPAWREYTDVDDIDGEEEAVPS